MRTLLYNLDESEPAPDWWYNFLRSSSPSQMGLIAELKQYGAMVEAVGQNFWLVFESEAHYTWFLLRFSS